MRLAVLVAVIFLALPFGASADQLDEDASALGACIEDAWPRDARALCAGAISAPCQLALGEQTHANMAICLTREADAWNAVMESQFPELLRRAEEVDAAGTATGAETSSATLQNAQRAWLLYRDAECRYAVSSWSEEAYSTILIGPLTSTGSSSTGVSQTKTSARSSAGR